MNSYDRLKSIIDEIDSLIAQQVSAGSPAFQAWKVKVERFLIYEYGKESYEYKQFGQYHFSLSLYGAGTPQSEFIAACKRDLLRVQAVFSEYLNDLNNIEVVENKNQPTYDCSKVFIVHGHNGELRESTARILEKQRIKPIILFEQSNQGATIIEKLEKNNDVGAAICLFSADDVGTEKSKIDEGLKDRARQNVVFEAGLFIGILGRNRVIIIADKTIEMPSDLQGVVYTDTSNWTFEVLKELKAMGYSIDYNKLDD